MDEAALLFGTVEQKAKELIHHVESLRLLNHELRKENEQLTQIITEQKQKIKDLEKQIEISNVTGSYTTEESREEIRTRINGLVNEIDRCINLLNT